MTEMEDVLQIAVPAFLRLKIANESLNLHQPCIFAHHNVYIMNAIHKLQGGKQILVKNLDDMTLAAAVQENVSRIGNLKI